VHRGDAVGARDGVRRLPDRAVDGLAVVLYVAAAYVGPPPSRTVLVKFWGTQAEIDKLAAPRQPVGSR
jgi:sodium/pantothenate symporter